mgnify:CR=1 FL=1
MAPQTRHHATPSRRLNLYWQRELEQHRLVHVTLEGRASEYGQTLDLEVLPAEFTITYALTYNQENYNKGSPPWTLGIKERERIGALQYGLFPQHLNHLYDVVWDYFKDTVGLHRPLPTGYGPRDQRDPFLDGTLWRYHPQTSLRDLTFRASLEGIPRPTNHNSHDDWHFAVHLWRKIAHGNSHRVENTITMEDRA